jgi:hypothetical protein
VISSLTNTNTLSHVSTNHKVVAVNIFSPSKLLKTLRRTNQICYHFSHLSQKYKKTCTSVARSFITFSFTFSTLLSLPYAVAYSNAKWSNKIKTCKYQVFPPSPPAKRSEGKRHTVEHNNNMQVIYYSFSSSFMWRTTMTTGDDFLNFP